jgi:hypothetical protein
MKRYLGWAFMLGLAAVGGCQRADLLQEGLTASKASTRNVGDASYQQAYVAAREVISQYFSIDPDRSNAASGMVQSRPKDVLDAGNERLLGGSPARQIAKLQIVQEGPLVTAYAQVMQQRQGASAQKRMGYSQERYNYSGNPGDESPADIDAATTPQQNESWFNEKRRRDVETQLLEDLSNRLQGAAK